MKGYIFIFLILLIRISAYGSSGINNRIIPQQVDTVKIIQDIRKKFQKINARERSFKKVIKDILDESSEGGQADVYYDGDILKKMIITHYGEMGKITMEYYIEDGAVFFIYIRQTMYDKPIYVKGSAISSVEEDRCYFYQGKMIRWIDSSKNIVKTSSEFFLAKEKELLNDTLLKFED